MGVSLPNGARAIPASGPAASSGPVHVEIADSAGEVDVMRKWMLDAAARGMADAGVTVDEVLPGRELVVQVEGVVFDYQYVVGVRTPTGWVGTTQSMVCSCEDEELIANVRAAVTEAAPRLQGDPQPSMTPADKDAGRRPLGAKGIAGASLLGLGVAGLVAGVVLVVRPDERTTRSDDRERYEGTTTKPAGVGLLAVGSIAAITGAVLLSVAVKTRKKSVAWAPTLGARFVGVSLGGKF